MKHTLLSPDGIVKGSIDNNSGTKAKIWLNLSIYNNAPIGAFYSIIQTRDKKNKVNSYTISSNSPIRIETRISGEYRTIKTNFTNTIAYNSTINETVYVCRTILTAAQTQPGIWNGTLTILYPDDRKLNIYGDFHGSVTVNRQFTSKRDKIPNY